MKIEQGINPVPKKYQDAAIAVNFARDGFHIVRDLTNNSVTVVATVDGFVSFLGIPEQITVQTFLDSGRFKVLATLDTSPFHIPEGIYTGL